MKAIISPAKKMRVLPGFADLTEPFFIKRAEEMAEYLKSLEPHEIESLMKVSPKLATETFIYYDEFLSSENSSPAVLSYDGIQYRHIHVDEMNDIQKEYLSGTLRIISGLYGVLRPFDSVRRYRLEMGTKLEYRGFNNLYDYWGESIADEVMRDDDILINLASNEYSKAVIPHLKEGKKLVNITFRENVKGRMKTVAVHAKVLRGEMITFMCKNRVESIDELKDFVNDGFVFKSQNERKNATELVFEKE